MMNVRTERRRIDQFSATGNDGRHYTVTVDQEFKHATFTDGTTQSAPGSKFYSLANGEHVNKLDDNNYEVAASGLKLVRK